MKSPLEWDEEYVLNLPLGEHDWLEFKSAEKLDFSLPRVDRNDVLSELSKQISAFANTGGGTIVYGIEDTHAGSVRRVDRHRGVSLNLTKQGTKEWLEDVIPGLVDSPLSRFNVYIVLKSIGGSSLADDKAIILIDIPSSESAPHQANDNRYYARVSGKSRPIGHRLVLDIMGRAKYPKMELEFKFSKERRGRGLESVLVCYCKNVGRVYANYVNFVIYIPEGMKKSWRADRVAHDTDGKKYRRFYFENLWKDYLGSEGSGMYSISKYISRYDPILPSRLYKQRIDIDIDVYEVDLGEISEEYIYWTIYADNAPVIDGKTRIGDIGFKK